MRSKKWLYCLISLLLLLGCKTSETIGEIPFTSVARGEYSNFQQGRHLIKSAAEWNSVLSGLTLPEIDFAKEMVIAVMRGQKRTSGFEVEIRRVESTGKEIKIYVNEHEPGICNVIFVFTGPFHVIRLQRLDLPVTFEINRKVCQ